MNNLISAYKKCKEPVTLSTLGTKYSEIYTSEAYTSMLKKCAPNKRLKRFLENQTSHFAVDKDGNVILINRHTEKQDCDLETRDHGATIQTTICSSFDKDEVHQVRSTRSTTLQPMPLHESAMNNTSSGKEVHQASGMGEALHKSINVRFYYGTKIFPREIKCADIESFKNQVLQILSSKLPNCRPVQVQYKFGDEMYLLEGADSFEELLIGGSMKVEITAIPEQCTSDSPAKNSGVVTTIQSSPSKCNNANTISSETFPPAEDINKKNDLKTVIDSCINFLQRSLAILLMSVMIKVYGTDQWLDQLKKAFPRDDKKGPNKELEHISDSHIMHLPADELFKVDYSY